jgi:large subunit ribosomal protein L24
MAACVKIGDNHSVITMKKTFSTAWKASSQPRKQRKYLHNAPAHIRGKLLTAALSADLTKKHSKKSARVRVGDKVKALRGKFRGTEGKVENVSLKTGKVKITGFEVSKRDGSKAKVAVHASNLMIMELNLDDKERMK